MDFWLGIFRLACFFQIKVLLGMRTGNLSKLFKLCTFRLVLDSKRVHIQ